ncbi:MAG: sulfur carrier protein ThiS [Cytophagaceae bacterium]|nr:sulfur carrier protein ThiS [Cytophagaceae bacterium]
MIVFINNEKRETENQITVDQLLNQIQMQAAKGIAIAINNEVIPKNSWNNHYLKDSDKVTIIKATQGG